MDIYFYSKEKAINSIDVTIDKKHMIKLKNLNKSKTINPRKSILISSQKEKINHIKPLGFLLVSIILFTFESMDPFGPKYFLSIYNGLSNVLIFDALIEVKDKNIESITIRTEKKELKNISIISWVSNEVNVKNTIEMQSIKKILFEFILFWSINIIIPFIIILIIVLYAYIKTNTIFEIGILFLAFLLMVLFVMVFHFIYEYYSLKKFMKSIINDNFAIKE